MEPKRFSKEQIDKITYGISSLDHAQRELVRGVMYDRMHIGDGKIGPQELHLELLKLRKAYKISDLDMKNVEDAFFGT